MNLQIHCTVRDNENMFDWMKSLFSKKTLLSVSIPVADDFPNPEELDARNEIMDALEARSIGKFVGAGGGFSQMDFSYEVSDPEVAKQHIAEAIHQRLPGKQYEITVD